MSESRSMDELMVRLVRDAVRVVQAALCSDFWTKSVREFDPGKVYQLAVVGFELCTFPQGHIPPPILPDSDVLRVGPRVVELKKPEGQVKFLRVPAEAMMGHALELPGLMPEIVATVEREVPGIVQVPDRFVINGIMRFTCRVANRRELEGDPRGVQQVQGQLQHSDDQVFYHSMHHIHHCGRIPGAVVMREIALPRRATDPLQ